MIVFWQMIALFSFVSLSYAAESRPLQVGGLPVT